MGGQGRGKGKGTTPEKVGTPKIREPRPQYIARAGGKVENVPDSRRRHLC